MIYITASLTAIFTAWAIILPRPADWCFAVIAGPALLVCWLCEFGVIPPFLAKYNRQDPWEDEQ